MFPKTEQELRASKLFNRFWYYAIELLPGLLTPARLHLNKKNWSEGYSAARHTLAGINANGLRCLDIGTMEGLVPALWRRQGASRVLAIDAFAHCLQKIDIVKHYLNLSFDYLLAPPNIPLPRYLRDVEFTDGTADNPGFQEFDLINLSGVLYHVWSPIHWLASVRPLLRAGGLIVISTHVVDRDSRALMEFNDNGRFQNQIDTFWYVSTAALDYMLRYLALRPVAMMGYRSEKDRAYVGVACRAETEIRPLADDRFMRASFERSLELGWHSEVRQRLQRDKDRTPFPDVPYSHTHLPPACLAQGQEALDIVQAFHALPDKHTQETLDRYNFVLRLDAQH